MVAVIEPVGMVVLQGIAERLPLQPIWGTAIGFVVVDVSAMVAIGFGGKNLAVGALGGYLMFAHFAMITSINVLEQTFYATFVLIIVALAFKIFRSEIGGDV